MRVATIVVVLVIHVVFLGLFALRIPTPRTGKEESRAMAFLLLPDERPQPPTAAQAASRTRLKRAAPAESPAANVTPQPESPSNAITAPAAPDWRRELQIAANNEIEAQERKRHQPSPLAPHDFSGVQPGSTTDSKPRFGWNHAATHRIEEIPTGGLLININDRCVIAWVVFPLPFCRIGKIPVRGDLFEHMQDPAPPGEPEVP
jgi:hypothetical protein